MPPISIFQALQIAVQHQQNGRLDLAETIYRQILAAQPNPNAMNLLGVLCGQRGHYQEAERLLKQAIAARPAEGSYLVNLGRVLEEQNRIEEAASCYRTALTIGESAEAHNNLGFILHRQKEYDQAILCFQKAISLNGRLAGAYNNLGNAYREKAMVPEALTAHAKALEIDPKYAEGHNSLGNALLLQGRNAEAIAAYQEAIRLKPDYSDAYSNVAYTYRELGRLDEAIAAARKAVELKPDSAEAHLMLGMSVHGKGDFEQAIAEQRDALRLKPSLSTAFLNLGNIYKDRGELDEAIRLYREALKLGPEGVGTYDNLLLTMQYHPGYSALALREELRHWNQLFAVSSSRMIQPHGNDPSPGRRLRIGYVSADFRDHAVGQNILPLFKSHDRGGFEIFCYANNTMSDAMTEEFRRLADHWRAIKGTTDESVAAMVREDGIDILVDLSLHTGGNRLLVFACKPAPVQLTFAGYPGSTGLETIDYRLTDPYLDPPGTSDDAYSEKSLRLPHSFWCYQPAIADMPVGPLPCHQAKIITFACLNNFCKISDGSLKTWARILRELPESRLVLLTHEGSHRARVHKLMESEEIETVRVEFLAPRPRRNYLELYNFIDITLDSLPYNGHTTSLDSLWMGVPVVSQVGSTVVGRGGLSQLTNLGLQELVGDSEDAYCRIATTLASDIDRLSSLRAGLRERMERSPLMDGVGFARGIENAYRSAWAEWCRR